jgi:hypothetical protein
MFTAFVALFDNIQGYMAFFENSSINKPLKGLFL